MNNATRTNKLIMARRWRRNRRMITVLWRRAFVASKVEADNSWTELADASAATSTMGLVKANPRVEVGVHDVRDEVEQDDENRGYHQPAEHHPRLDLGHGVDDQRPHALPIEHPLGDDRAGEHHADVQRR